MHDIGADARSRIIICIDQNSARGTGYLRRRQKTLRTRSAEACITIQLRTDAQGYASMYSSDSAEDSEKERTEKGKIGRLAKKRFEAMLRAMSGKRAEIGRAMEFAMNKAEAADDVS